MAGKGTTFFFMPHLLLCFLFHLKCLVRMSTFPLRPDVLNCVDQALWAHSVPASYWRSRVAGPTQAGAAMAKPSILA